MEEEKIKPNTIVYSAAISACGAAGEWEAALGLLQQMGTRGIPRNTICYNAAIQACGNGLAWQQALTLFDRMKAAGVERDRVTHNLVVKACERAGQYKEAFDVRMQAAALGGLDGGSDEWPTGEDRPPDDYDGRSLLREQR